MAYCKNCGAPIADNAVMCPQCGMQQNNAPRNDDKGGFGWGLLGFCVPVVGLILYLVWKTDKPNSSKAAGKGALISVIITVAMYAISFILAMVGAAGGY